MKFRDYVKCVECHVAHLAEENTEGSYVCAVGYVEYMFKRIHIPLTDRQVTKFVNQIWDRVNKED